MDKYLDKNMKDDTYLGDDGSIRSFTSWKNEMETLRREAKDNDLGTDVPGVTRHELFARGLPTVVISGKKR